MFHSFFLSVGLYVCHFYLVFLCYICLLSLSLFCDIFLSSFCFTWLHGHSPSLHQSVITVINSWLTNRFCFCFFNLLYWLSNRLIGCITEFLYSVRFCFTSRYFLHSLIQMWPRVEIFATPQNMVTPGWNTAATAAVERLTLTAVTSGRSFDTYSCNIR